MSGICRILLSKPRAANALMALLIGVALSGCASDPAWLRETVDAPFYKHATPDSPVTKQAAADPRRIELIERAALRSYDEAKNPELPHWQIGKLVWALWWNSRNAEYLELARRLAAHDPVHYNEMRAELAGQLPLDECEGELLPIAFCVLPPDAPRPAREGRAAAARLLVQKCAFEAGNLPRRVPEGPPLRMQPDETDAMCRADQWGLMAAYGGPLEVSLRKMEQWMAQDVANDHDRAELETIAARLRGEMK